MHAVHVDHAGYQNTSINSLWFGWGSERVKGLNRRQHGCEIEVISAVSTADQQAAVTAYRISTGSSLGTEKITDRIQVQRKKKKIKVCQPAVVQVQEKLEKCQPAVV